MTQPETLEQKVDRLEAILNAIVLSDRYMFGKNIQIQDGRSISVGGTTGTRIGTSALQKLGFFGASPVAQPGAISAPSGGTTIDTQARSAISSIINVLHTLGFTA